MKFSSHDDENVYIGNVGLEVNIENIGKNVVNTALARGG